MKIINFIHHLKKDLEGEKPGVKAQLKMITRPRPGHRPFEEAEGKSLKAGVLVLIYPWKNRLHLVLTRRTERMSFHQAQISFPGGRKEKAESIEQAALREANEELNISPESLTILGKLTPLYIPASNHCIYPIVAFTKKRPKFRPSPQEVAEVIEIPLDHLLDSKNRKEEIWKIKDMEVVVPFYSFEEHKIWGATAMVISELIELLEKNKIFLVSK